MKKRRIWLAVICALLLAMIPTFALAKDWWIVEVEYTLNDRAPVETTGVESRIFLPKISVKTVDGLSMNMNYSVSKDGTVVQEGEYAEDVFYDLNGAGTYVFAIQGVDASNAYTFRIVADENLPSLILEAPVCLSTGISKELVLPAATVKYKGEAVNATIDLHMQSGAIYAYEEKTVPELGLMTVQYSTEIAGEQIHYTYEVSVDDDTLGFYDENGDFYPAGTKAYDNMSLSGAVLNSSLTKTYTFSQIVDLSQITKDTPLIVINNAAFTAEKTTPKIRIVDAHNARNYIEITGRWSADNANMVYSVAGIGGQAPIGHKSGKDYYNGTVFGTETNFPTSTNISKDMPGIYYYDAAEKAVYARWYDNTLLIADFDAGYNATAWEGFTTGEVYIQVIRTNDSDFVCVEEIAGVNLRKIEKDTMAPFLSVEQGTGGIAIVGKKYPLMNAVASDVMEGNIPVEVHVYKGCDATAGIEMNIVDGGFVPYDAGYYTAVYTATDSYGNKTTQKFNIQAKSESEIDPIEADITGLPENAYVGEKLMLPTPKNVSGGSGDVRYVINLISPDGIKTELTEEYVIMPQKGINVIEYVFTDYLGMSTTIPVQINCTQSATPVLYDVQLPSVLFTGTKLQIPEMEYAQLGDSVSVSVSVTLDGKALTINDGYVVPETANRSAELKIIYEGKNANGSTKKEYTIQVLGADANDRTTYFYTTSGLFDILQKDSAIGFTTTVSGSSVQFANSVLADKLALVLAVDPAQNDCDRITIWASDSLDSSIQVRFDIVKKADTDANGSSEFYINGVKANDISGNFYSTATALGISYQKNSRTVVDAQRNTLGKIMTTANGDYFDGFPSGECNIVISCGTVGEGGFAFDVQKINNQVFAGGDSFFNSYPEIQLNASLPLEVSVGDKISIPGAIGADVLSPNVTILLTVKKGNEVVLENLAVDRDYEFTFDNYGTYYIVYKYSDGTTNRTLSYTIKTIEAVPPEIDMPTQPTTGKVGEKITLEMPTVSDDQSAQPGISIIVCEPNNNMFKISADEMCFVPKRAGKYTVFFYAYDECNNYTIVEHVITVTE